MQTLAFRQKLVYFESRKHKFKQNFLANKQHSTHRNPGDMEG